MMIVQLEPAEWQQVVAIVATGPWNIANPLLTKLSEQLQRQQEAARTAANGGEQPRAAVNS